MLSPHSFDAFWTTFGKSFISISLPYDLYSVLEFAKLQALLDHFQVIAFP